MQFALNLSDKALFQLLDFLLLIVHHLLQLKRFELRGSIILPPRLLKQLRNKEESDYELEASESESESDAESDGVVASTPRGRTHRRLPSGFVLADALQPKTPKDTSPSILPRLTISENISDLVIIQPRNCPRCGNKEKEAGAEFCAICGLRIDASTQQTPKRDTRERRESRATPRMGGRTRQTLQTSTLVAGEANRKLCLSVGCNVLAHPDLVGYCLKHADLAKGRKRSFR